MLTTDEDRAWAKGSTALAYIPLVCCAVLEASAHINPWYTLVYCQLPTIYLWCAAVMIFQSVDDGKWLTCRSQKSTRIPLVMLPCGAMRTISFKRGKGKWLTRSCLFSSLSQKSLLHFFSWDVSLVSGSILFPIWRFCVQSQFSFREHNFSGLLYSSEGKSN